VGGWKDGWMDGWMGGWIVDGWVGNGWIDGSVDGCVGGWMDPWMDRWSSCRGRMWTEINPAQIRDKCKDGKVLARSTIVLWLQWLA
jgi:hypothetical protein